MATSRFNLVSVARVHLAHAAQAYLFDDFIMGNGGAEHSYPRVSLNCVRHNSL